MSISNLLNGADSVYTSIWHGAYILMTIPIIVGNGLIILSIVKFPSLRTNMHILICNVAISDFLIGTVLVPLDIAADMSHLNAVKYYCLGKLSIFVVSLGSSCVNLLLISIERFVAIVFPLRSRTYRASYMIHATIMVAWSVCIVNAVLPLTGWNSYNSTQVVCVSDDVWTLGYQYLVNWELLVSLVANFVLYTIVMRIALRKARSSEQQLGSGPVTVHTRSQRDLQRLKTMVIVLGLFAVCWFPYAATIAIITFYDTPGMRLAKRIALIPGLMNSAVNSFVYGYRNQDFREAFKSILHISGERGRLQQTRVRSDSYTMSVVFTQGTIAKNTSTESFHRAESSNSLDVEFG